MTSVDLKLFKSGERLITGLFIILSSQNQRRVDISNQGQMSKGCIAIVIAEKMVAIRLRFDNLPDVMYTDFSASLLKNFEKFSLFNYLLFI